MSMSMPITDAGATTWAFLEIIGRVELGEVEDLLSLGISHDLINTLRQLPTSELMRLSAMSYSNPLFRIVINEDALNLALRKLSRVTEESQLLEYFIRSGASPTMLTQFFSAPAVVLAEYRKTLNAPMSAGRPRLPATSIRDGIHASWQKLSEVMDMRQRYIQLHKRFPDLSLSTLHAVVNEFAD